MNMYNRFKRCFGEESLKPKSLQVYPVWLTREDAKLLRRILAVGTWDTTNLSEDESNLIIRLQNELIDYLHKPDGYPF